LTTSGEAVGDSEDSAIGVVDVEKWTGKSVTERWGQRGRGPQGGLYDPKNRIVSVNEIKTSMWLRSHEKTPSLSQILLLQSCVNHLRSPSFRGKASPSVGLETVHIRHFCYWRGRVAISDSHSHDVATPPLLSLVSYTHTLSLPRCSLTRSPSSRLQGTKPIPLATSRQAARPCSCTPRAPPLGTLLASITHFFESVNTVSRFTPSITLATSLFVSGESAVYLSCLTPLCNSAHASLRHSCFNNPYRTTPPFRTY